MNFVSTANIVFVMIILVVEIFSIGIIAIPIAGYIIINMYLSSE